MKRTASCIHAKVRGVTIVVAAVTSVLLGLSGCGTGLSDRIAEEMDESFTERADSTNIANKEEGLFVEDGHPYVTLDMPSGKSIDYCFDIPSYVEHDTSTYYCVHTYDAVSNSEGILGYAPTSDGGWVGWINGRCIYTPDDVGEKTFRASAVDFAISSYQPYDLSDVETLESYGISLNDAWTNTGNTVTTQAEATSLNIITPYDFYDGVAWVNTSDGKALVDNEGHVLIVYDDDWNEDDIPIQMSNYHEGRALASMPFGQGFPEYPTAIIDKTGHTVWTLEEDARAEADEVFGEGNVEDIDISFDLEDDVFQGYAAVRFNVNTPQYTGTCIGVINGEGDWVVEPSLPADLENSDLVCGDSRYFIQTEYYLVDYDDGQVYFRDGSFDEQECSGSFSYGGKTADEFANEKYFSAHDGLKYGICIVDGYSDGPHFLDSDNNIVINMDNYSVNSSWFDATFVDGYCLVPFSNTGGGNWLTVIDTHGQETMAPIKDCGHGVLGEGIFFYKGETDTGGYYIKVNGERLGTGDGSDGTTFHEGRAWLNTDGHYHCINTDGEILF